MTARALAILFCLMFSGTGVSLHAEVSFTPDRFTGQTIIEARQRTLLGSYPCLRPGVVWRAVVEKEPVEPPPVVSLMFEARCAGWLYLECHSVHALKDGEPYALPESEHDGTVLSGGSVHERIQVVLSLGQLKELAAAESLEFRICKSELKLKKKELQDITAFLAAIDPHQ